MRRCLAEGKKESDVIPHKESLLIAKMMEEIMKQIGVQWCAISDKRLVMFQSVSYYSAPPLALERRRGWSRSKYGVTLGHLWSWTYL